MSDQADITTRNDLLPLNWEHLHEISDGDPEFEMELLQMFVEDAQLHVDAVKEALDNHDFQKLGREAHHLKGASANVGATPMQLAAQELEQKVHQQQLEGSNNLVAQLETFINSIQAYLNSQ
jgi:HPt (histidine-containing phosphotransfer) domain-containing protein